MDVLQAPCQMVAFGITVHLIWQTISKPETKFAMHACEGQEFFLAIPGIARFLVLPKENTIVIETEQSDIDMNLLNSWILGTLMAYILQYHGFLVLHGAAVFMNEGAVILSGHSGAGKSTLAAALTAKGHPFITDDLIVIQPTSQGQYALLPGPQKFKLWKDAMLQFNYEIQHALPVNLKSDKYAVPVMHVCHEALIPITSFYEINITQSDEIKTQEVLLGCHALRILMQNAYRYFMLKPLGQLPAFLKHCSALTQQLTVHRIMRTPYFEDLPKIIQQIEQNQGVTL
ncbi:MAG: hypothetical protein K0U37_00095 [Gammaproteobacteria bacterium]|nr:hypothetical protein [Gammaproteobacteria bacterium]